MSQKSQSTGSSGSKVNALFFSCRMPRCRATSGAELCGIDSDHACTTLEQRPRPAARRSAEIDTHLAWARCDAEPSERLLDLA